MEEKKHSVVMTDRKELNLTGIVAVESFREDAAELDSTLGPLLLTGEGMHMEKLDLEKGEVSLTGRIVSLYYPDSTVEQKKGLFARIFR